MQTPRDEGLHHSKSFILVLLLFADLSSQVQGPFDGGFGEDLCFWVDLLLPEIVVYGGEVGKGGFGDFEGFVFFEQGFEVRMGNGLLGLSSQWACNLNLPILDFPSSLSVYVVKMTVWGLTPLSERDFARHSNSWTPSRSSEKWLKMRMGRLDH